MAGRRQERIKEVERELQDREQKIRKLERKLGKTLKMEPDR